MNKRRMSIGIGLCSLMMIFTCLVLTIFATLSYLQAKRNLDETNRINNSIVSYMDVDGKASLIYLDLKDNLNNEEFLNENNIEYNNGVYSYKITIDSNSYLSVSLLEDNGTLTIDRWQEVTSSDGEYEYSGFVN